MNSALFVVVLITGLALVGAALLIAGLISPRSFNPQKGEAYECGIPSRGDRKSTRLNSSHASKSRMPSSA